MERSDIKNGKVLVIGAGISGVGSVRLLNANGAATVLLEENRERTEDEIRGRLREEDRDRTDIIIGTPDDALLDELSLVVPSPAVPMDSEIIRRTTARGIPVWSEVELAYNFMEGRLIAITGTNGKTTTTTLTGEICRAAFGKDRVHVVGNIGYSFAEEAMNIRKGDIAVAEISSFQLEAVDHFHAEVSAILNITPDHLNRHHTMENYAAVKEKITNRQAENDTCVLNYSDTYLPEIGKRSKAGVIWFSGKESLENGYYLDGDEIKYAENGKHTVLMNVLDMNLVGVCNAENVMAAMGITRALDIPMDTIIRTVRDFKAVPHRIEYISTVNGVKYYNDSKATNPDAAIQGILAMRSPTILIGGGYDKGNEYDEWIESFGGKVRKLVLIGATADKIEKCAREHGFTDSVRCGSFEEALKYCAEEAKEGENVLLSPACASWDMFPSYEVRGDRFREFVLNISEQKV